MQTEELKQFKGCDETLPDEKQIYIVDDDQSVRRALKLLMLAYGFAVETFSSSEDFFSAIPNSTPGCLILDINMPGLSGWEAQQILLRKRSGRPVIFITADRNVSFREKALKAGARGILQKPFVDKELIELINRAI